MIQKQSTAATETDNAQENVALPSLEVTRVFVSGLPLKFTSEQLAAHFGSEFKVTDAHVLADRRIGFVGFKDSSSAAKARAHFNKSYVRMSKITVDLARPVELSTVSGTSVPVSRRGHQTSEADSNRKRKRTQQDDGEAIRMSIPEKRFGKEDANSSNEEDKVEPVPQPSTTDNDWLRGRTNRTLDLVDPDEAQIQEEVMPEGALPKDLTATSKPAPTLEKEVAKETSAPAPTPRSVPNARLFLRNLAYSVDQDDLQKRFEQFGKIQEVSLYTFSLRSFAT